MDDPRRFVHIGIRNGEPFLVVTGDVVVKDSQGLSFVRAARGANPRTVEQEIARVARLQAQAAPAKFEEL